MAKIDKEMFDKLGFDSSRATYVPLSKDVTRFLKRKKGDRVLVSYILHTSHKGKNKDLNVLCYYRELEGSPIGGPVFYKEKTSFEMLAQYLAVYWPEYMVKHRKNEE